MAETIRIEIPIETIDNTDPELSNITKGFQKLEDAADDANSSVKTANTTVSKFDDTAEKTQKTLAKWAQEKYEVLLEAKDKVGPVLTTLGTNLKSIAGKAWSVTMKAVDLATAPIRGIINLLKNPIFQVGAVLGITISLSDVIETYTDFEAAMSEVSAISGATGDELDKLTEKAKEMGSTTKFTAQEAAEAFTYMGMAGWSASEMMDGIEGILNLAAASGEDLADVSDIVTDALTAFGLQASDAAEFSDVLAAAASSANTTVSGMGETFKYAGSMAGSLGYSIQDVALMTGLMANTGVKGTMAGTALNTIFTRLSTNTGNAADAIKELGVEFYDSEGNARDLSDVMEELRAATADMNDEQKSALANTVAGTAAQKGLLAILNASEEDYNSLADAINNADGAAESMSETMLDNLSGSITLLQSALDGVKLSMGERIAPYIRKLADWLTDQMGTIEEISTEFFDWVDTKVASIQKKFGEIKLSDEWQNADLFGKAKILWDEFIVEPFSDWWNSKGKAKIAEIAEKIGGGIGSALKTGVLALLGIDIADSVDEGASVGKSFAQGFTDGLDFDLISSKLKEGLGNLFSSASGLLTGDAGLSSVISAMILAKLASTIAPVVSGTVGVGKALFGSQESLGGASLVGTLVGSAPTGSGLLGLGSMTAINLGAGNLAGGASLSTGALSALGLGSIAGGIAAGATLVSAGKDVYSAVTTDDAEAKSTYASSAGLKVGGVAAGAATGALIGSVIPGIGTAVGALVGAGIGGIGGWIAGNKVKEEYEESVEEAQQQAELAQKAYEVTGLSIDKVHFKTEELNEALQDTDLTAEELAVMIQEDCADRLSEAFGDVSLTLAEIQSLAQKIVFDSAVDSVTEFASATSDVETSLSSLDSAVTALNKQNWKVGLGLELSESEQEDYKSAIDTFVADAQEYIENSHYQATVALSLLTDGEGDTTNLDSVYNSLKEQLSDISDQLASELEISLEDGIITLDESAELLNLQEQITEITNKLTTAQQEAELETLKIKYTNGAELDADSWTQLQAELQSQMEEYQSSYDEALTVSLTNLKLQLSEGAITQEEYDAQVEELTADYVAHINDMSVRIESFSLETIATAWSDELDGILPEIEGTTAEKLQTALNNALLINPDASTWTQEEVMEWFDLGDIDTSAFENIFSELVSTAESVGDATKEDILQNYQNSIPTAEEIKESIDWDSMTVGDWQEMLESVTGPPEGETLTVSSDAVDQLMSDYYGDYFESVKESYSNALENALTEAQDQNTLSDFLSTYMADWVANVDYSGVDFIGPFSQEIYDQLAELNLSETDWTALKESLSNGVATAIEDADMAKVISAINIVKGNVDTSIDTAFSSGTSTTMPIDVTLDYNILNPTKTFSISGSGSTSGSTTMTVTAHAAGGFVDGRQLSWVGEEGPEAIIPLVPGRRSRAIELYQEVGEQLGVTAHAAGGFVGGSNSANSGTDYNLFTEAVSNAPTGYQEFSEADNEEGTETVPADNSSESRSVSVSVQMSPQFNITAADGTDEESVMAIIRKNMKAMADELGGEIAERLEMVFSNMPVKEA